MEWKMAALALADELGRIYGLAPPGPKPEDETDAPRWLAAKAARMQRIRAVVERGDDRRRPGGQA